MRAKVVVGDHRPPLPGPGYSEERCERQFFQALAEDFHRRELFAGCCADRERADHRDEEKCKESSAGERGLYASRPKSSCARGSSGSGTKIRILAPSGFTPNWRPEKSLEPEKAV